METLAKKFDFCEEDLELGFLISRRILNHLAVGPLHSCCSMIGDPSWPD